MPFYQNAHPLLREPTDMPHPLKYQESVGQLHRNYGTATADYITRMQSAMQQITNANDPVGRIKDIFQRNPSGNYFNPSSPMNLMRYNSSDKQIRRNFYNIDPQLDYVQ